ncbi:MAG TPA: TAT-variant-translocated molybdopterin oxidoreductase, partial [Terriglobales bacterium]|nr:TAT-variant-translocated molybdopterin oxidoreductase [Terriglobales bacterium]
MDDLNAIRQRLSGARGPEYWRCLEELADSGGFKELVSREAPRQAAVWSDALDRRDFLKLMGASLALAGLSGCLSSSPAPPDEKIVPYVKQPEEIVPGKPLYFATAMPLQGYGRGILVESHMGRPTKVEGNPDHPASFGATDAVTQASVLGLYDPDRSHAISNAGRISTWNAFFNALNIELEAQRLSQGAGLRILTETVTSPTLAQQIQDILNKFPKAKWHQYQPFSGDNARQGARLAFGEVVETVYRFDRAQVILSLGADFLFEGPANVRYARDFANQRRVDRPNAEMNRLYVVESTPSITGAMADHRLPLPPQALETFAKQIANGLGLTVPGVGSGA